MALSKGKTLVLAGILSTAAITGTLAFFSGKTETEYNHFSIVAGEAGEEGAGEIVEPSWNPENADGLTPNTTIPKDPYLKSNVEYEAWAFIKVEMPTAESQIEGEDSASVHDAFDYNINEDWVLIDIENTGKSDVAGENSVYIYAYKHKLPGGDQTSTLFDELIVPNYISLPNGIRDSVDITGYLVQTEGFSSYTAAAAILDFGGTVSGGGTTEDPEPIENTAILMRGYYFNEAIRALAGTDVVYDHDDFTIKHIERSYALPEKSVETQNLAAEGSEYAITGWFDTETGTVYYYTEADKIKLNENSEYLFHDFKALETIDVSDFDTSNVTTLKAAFRYCNSLTEIIGLETWNVKSVTSFESMFNECENLTTIDLSGWDVSNIETMLDMFKKCGKLSKESVATMDDWNINPSTSFETVFQYCKDPAQGGNEDFYYPAWSGIWDDNGTFTPGNEETLPITLEGSDINSYIIELSGGAENVTKIQKGNSLPSSDIKTANISYNSLPAYIWYDNGIVYYYSDSEKIVLNPISEKIFDGLENVTAIDVSGFETNAVTSMYAMFRNCNALTEITGFENWNTEFVENMEQMFKYCHSLKTADFSSWDVSNVTNMNEMFKYNYKLTDETVKTMNDWVINQNCKFDSMFYNCNKESEGGNPNFVYPTWNGTWNENGTFSPAN